MENDRPILNTDFPGFPVRRGKVRDIYDLGEELLLVATDRISAFDVVLPTGIPGKGVMLTKLSQYWLSKLPAAKPNHLLEVVGDQAPKGLEAFLPQLRGRAMRCRKAEVIPIEFIIRGYLAGSGWNDYQQTGAVCGIRLPAGLRQCEQLPEPLFTPSTKTNESHDQNISYEQAREIAGEHGLDELRDRSLELYRQAATHAQTRGIIIADTKFEWGQITGRYMLIDEVLTPDSSRFWPAESYERGRDQDSFDKQYVRNYLLELVKAGTWNKTPPGPDLPKEVVEGTISRYREAVERLIT